MDWLDEVRKTSKRLIAAEKRYMDAMLARNVAIREARSQRHGPAAIAAAAQLNPESVRRIYNAPDATPKPPTGKRRT